jgi:hypothetical protein
VVGDHPTADLDHHPLRPLQNILSQFLAHSFNMPLFLKRAGQGPELIFPLLEEGQGDLAPLLFKEGLGVVKATAKRFCLPLCEGGRGDFQRDAGPS